MTSFIRDRVKKKNLPVTKRVRIKNRYKYHNYSEITFIIGAVRGKVNKKPHISRRSGKSAGK
jgi:hypothetical protein